MGSEHTSAGCNTSAQALVPVQCGLILQGCCPDTTVITLLARKELRPAFCLQTVCAAAATMFGLAAHAACRQAGLRLLQFGGFGCRAPEGFQPVLALLVCT